MTLWPWFCHTDLQKLHASTTGNTSTINDFSFRNQKYLRRRQTDGQSAVRNAEGAALQARPITRDLMHAESDSRRVLSRHQWRNMAN